MSDTKSSSLADKREVIYTLGLIALEFARIDDLIYSFIIDVRMMIPVAKINARMGVEQKCAFIENFGESFLNFCGPDKYRLPLTLNELVSQIRRLASTRNKFLHSSADYDTYSDAVDEALRKKITFFFRQHHTKRADEWVDASEATLSEMRQLVSDLRATSDMLLDILMIIGQSEHVAAEKGRCISN